MNDDVKHENTKMINLRSLFMTYSFRFSYVLLGDDCGIKQMLHLWAILCMGNFMHLWPGPIMRCNSTLANMNVVMNFRYMMQLVQRDVYSVLTLLLCSTKSSSFTLLL